MFINKFKKKTIKIVSTIFLLCSILSTTLTSTFAGNIANEFNVIKKASFVMGVASFSDAEKRINTSFEKYSPLDKLGRCGVAFACIGKDIMPTKSRGAIGMIKPTGWQTPASKYNFVDGLYLYNRCHLIAFQLAGENANEKNLITGTRYMNTEGMLPYENLVAQHIKNTNHHVLYRSTPVFEGSNLLCEGVTIEAYCVDEHGGPIDFTVFCYNVQPGVIIDYATGKNHLDPNYAPLGAKNKTDTVQQVEQIDSNSEASTYVLNINSKKFHLPSCSSVQTMKEKNKKVVNEKRQSIIEKGYSPCSICKP